MTEFYTRIYWYNKSDNLTTPLGKTNLNKMDSAIKTLDGRTVELYTEVVRINTAKADKSQLNGMVTNWQVDNKTGIVTLTKYDGTKISINTALNQLAVNFEYNSATQQLIITQTDGTKKIVDMSALITQYEFLNSDTITFEVQSDGKIKAIVKEGSIEEKHLRPDYLADIKIETTKAQGYAKDAKDSADNAAYDAKLSQSYAVGGTGTRENEDTDNSKYYKEQAEKLAGGIADSADEILDKAEFIQENINAAKEAADTAIQKADEAKLAADTACKCKEQAQEAADTATQKADEAKVSADNAKNSEDKAAEYCETTKSYKEQAQEYAESGQETLDTIIKKLQMTEFSLDDDGNLVYTEPSSFLFTVKDDANLHWEVA